MSEAQNIMRASGYCLTFVGLILLTLGLASLFMTSPDSRYLNYSRTVGLILTMFGGVLVIAGTRLKSPEVKTIETHVAVNPPDTHVVVQPTVEVPVSQFPNSYEEPRPFDKQTGLNYCPYCGKSAIVPDAVFCATCGKRLTGVED